MTTISVIVASNGRPTLPRTIESARSQMREGDEILVSVNKDSPWGHAARNQLMLAARCDVLAFCDDDDHYLPGALDAIRTVGTRPDALHLYCMRYFDAESGSILGRERIFECGHVSTQMVVVMRRKIVKDQLLARFGTRYEGDWDFIREAREHVNDVVWHGEVIVLVRPPA
jgi:glycosyltransferase involved in cell wall biosynthesis